MTAAGFSKLCFMKIQLQDRRFIQTAVGQLSSKEDLLTLLNFSKRLIYGEKTVPIELKQLTWYANPGINKKRYTTFEIQKRTGGKRIIHAPVKGLKSLQYCLNLILSTVFEPHPAAMGFVPGRSVVTNAAIHTNSKYVYNIDLKDFFHSIDQARVWKCLQITPFDIGQASESLRQQAAELTPLLGFDMGPALTGSKYEVVNLISALCCTELPVEQVQGDGSVKIIWKNVLPQGAPTSPLITNIICQRLDHRLTGVAKRFGLRYTRYADDITFSSNHFIYQTEGSFQKEIQRIINQQGFQIKASKTRLQHEAYRQEVTGLVVNQRVNLHAGYIKQLRMWLYYWETYGYDKAGQLFLQDQVRTVGQTKKGLPGMLSVLMGKLQYFKMVRGADDKQYQLLFSRFKKLLLSISSRDQQLEEVLNILLAKGIDEAMHLYQPLKSKP
jgi:RNA-directed DNA polymerase